MLRYAACWLLLAIVAVANGALRSATYGKRMPELTAHQLSTLTLIVMTGLVAWVFHRAWPLTSPAQAWRVGALWLAMTIAFEFGFGRFVAGHSWSRLLLDYNLLDGRTWPLFLGWIFVLPWLVLRTSGN